MDYKKDRITEKRIENNIYKAIKCAEDFNRVFDFTPGSIKDLDHILAYYGQDVRISKLTDQQVYDLASIFGAYLGQVLLDQKYKEEGFAWIKEEDLSFPILKKDDLVISPIEKVYKRLKNGPGEDIRDYYIGLIEKDNS